jgi:hypothetical protein
MSVHDKGAHYIWYLRFCYYHWIDSSAGGLSVTEGIIRPVVSVTITGSIALSGGLSVTEGIIRPVVSASELTWFIIYIYYWNLQFLNNVIINKTKVLLPQV